MRFINFEAEINHPNDDGINKLKSSHALGHGWYNCMVCSSRRYSQTGGWNSVDDLSRVMVDIHQDIVRLWMILSHSTRKICWIQFTVEMPRTGPNLIFDVRWYNASVEWLKIYGSKEREYEIKQVVGDVIHGDFVGGVDTLILGREE